MQECPKCQSDRVIHNGSAAGKPKKQCKQCGDQFTRTTPRGKPLTTKINAVLWYLSGMSMNRVAFLLRVSAQAVLTWSRDFAKGSYEKPEPTGRTIVLQLDEMWHYVKKKRQKLWIWKALDRDTGQLLDWECGRWDKATLKKLVAVLIQADRFGTGIAQSLRAHADFMRIQARQVAEEKAAKLGVKLIFPIFFCILPSLFVVTVGPVLTRMVRDLIPMIENM